MARAQANNSRRLNLALQGGGAHGAFTSGVLDRLLEDGRIEIEGISGTSAGAMNAAVLAQGLTRGGRDGARKALDHFWRRIAAFSRFGPIRRSAIDRMFGNWNLDQSPGYLWLDAVLRLLSPYQFNLLGLNPLRDILASEIDIAAVRDCEQVKIFVCATNVRTGKIRVFERKDLTIDVLLASACLPHLFRAVEIDGDPYWDGGYMGNPAIFPLIYSCDSADVAIVQINPMTREGVPKTSTEILDRLSEINFNSSLMREMRAIAFVNRLLTEDWLKPDATSQLKAMRIHMIDGGDEMKHLGVASKFNAEIGFIDHLRAVGRRYAGDWLDANFAHIGERSTIDLRDTFL
ncbi:MAG: patatin-like phospholipase family protein [Stellaceae bacterium]